MPGVEFSFLAHIHGTDTCPRESVSAWAAALRAEHPTVLFRSGSAFLPSADVALAPVPVKGKGKERADDALGLDSVLSILEKWAGEKTGDEPLAVAVVGLTNVRPLLNALDLPLLNSCVLCRLGRAPS